MGHLPTWPGEGGQSPAGGGRGGSPTYLAGEERGRSPTYLAGGGGGGGGPPTYLAVGRGQVTRGRGPRGERVS